jgi:hypothetical protein
LYKFIKTKGFGMQISSNTQTVASMQSTTVTKTLFTEKLSKDEVDELREQIEKSTHAFTFNYTSIQISISTSQDSFMEDFQEFQSFLGDIGYTGKPIAELSQDEASELIDDDGIFGIKQTSQRIADFVVIGAGDNEDMLRAGREGILRGFKDAELMWGSELPDISVITMQKAIEMIDKTMADLGYSIIDEEV